MHMSGISTASHQVPSHMTMHSVVRNHAYVRDEHCVGWWKVLGTSIVQYSSTRRPSVHCQIGALWLSGKKWTEPGIWLTTGLSPSGPHIMRGAWSDWELLVSGAEWHTYIYAYIYEPKPKPSLIINVIIFRLRSKSTQVGTWLPHVNTNGTDHHERHFVVSDC